MPRVPWRENHPFHQASRQELQALTAFKTLRQECDRTNRHLQFSALQQNVVMRLLNKGGMSTFCSAAGSRRGATPP